MSQTFTKSAIAKVLKEVAEDLNESQGAALKLGLLKPGKENHVGYEAVLSSAKSPEIDFSIEFHGLKNDVCYPVIREGSLLSLLGTGCKDLDSLRFNIRHDLELYVVGRAVPLLPGLMDLIFSKVRWILAESCNVELGKMLNENSLLITRKHHNDSQLRVFVYGGSTLTYTTDVGLRSLTSRHTALMYFDRKKSYFSPDSFADWYAVQIYNIVIRNLSTSTQPVGKEAAKRSKKLFRGVPGELYSTY